MCVAPFLDWYPIISDVSFDINTVTVQPRGHRWQVTVQPRGHRRQVTVQPRGHCRQVTVQPRGHRQQVTVQPRGHCRQVTVQSQISELHPWGPLTPWGWI